MPGYTQHCPHKARLQRVQGSLGRADAAAMLAFCICCLVLPLCEWWLDLLGVSVYNPSLTNAKC